MTAEEAEEAILDAIEENVDAHRTGPPVTAEQRAAGRAACRANLRSKGIDFAGIGREFSREVLMGGIADMLAESMRRS